jgi:hypothetical protein
MIMSATEQQTDLAIQTAEGRELLALIHANELDPDDADSLSCCLFGRGLEALPLELLRRIWRSVKIDHEERDRRANPKPGTCWQCGGNTYTDSMECRPCREGMTRHRYARHEARAWGGRGEGW